MSTKHRKSSLGRSRDFGTEGAGKGDGDRTTDATAYAANYDAIDWGDKSETVSAPYEIKVNGFTCLNTPPQCSARALPRPDPETEDFESWDR